MVLWLLHALLFILVYLNTVCFNVLNQSIKKFIFKSILTTFIASVILRGGWGRSENWLELKIKPPSSNLVCLNRWNTFWKIMIYSYKNCHTQKNDQFVLEIAFFRKYLHYSKVCPNDKRVKLYFQSMILISLYS